MKLINQALLLVLVVTSFAYAQRNGHVGMPAAQHQNSKEWIGCGTSQEVQQEQMPATQGEVATEVLGGTSVGTRQAMPGCDPITNGC